MKRSRQIESMMNGATKKEREFFRVMDSYDWFYGEYVACIKKYEKNISDPDAIAKLSQMLDIESVMFRSMGRLDVSSMTKAENTYYMMVMDSIDNKLLAVSI